MNTVYYQPIYGRIYIVLGILFSIIFLLGFIVLLDFWILTYLLFSGFMIYLGVNTLRQPYARYNKTELILYRLTGSVRKKITYADPSEIKIQEGRLMYQGKKLKLNNWFVRQSDWSRMLRFYTSPSSDELLDELQEGDSSL